MPKELSTSRCLCLVSQVAARGRKVCKSCSSCWRGDADCLVDVLFSCCGCCIEKNLKCSLLGTQGDCQFPLLLSRNVPNESPSMDYINKQ